MSDTSTSLVHALLDRGLTVGVAESLTGGLLVAELIATPGASAVVRGGIVAYDTELKHSLLGVDAGLLAAHGPVHPEVAEQMARGVRAAVAVGGVPADIGISTTGVAGPDSQDGHPVGTVFVGLSLGDVARVVPLTLTGDRASIRVQTVDLALAALGSLLDDTRE